ncbi:VOC family protein [Litorihabitans aurantiacus]|uniref:VOC family protein n=1 Tax=Litorihabitans aurantiacus TaxID=1930061 RepID=UPI0024E1740F|nr:VOC family protein [Litorihabitans aurantiacus]
MTTSTPPTTIPADLDHVVYAGPDLAEAVDAVERFTGVRAAPGGVHPTGTANALIAFTVDGERVPHYLEVIGPDPDGDRPASEIATFAIRERTVPAVATFAVHPADIEATAERAAAAGVDLGGIRPLSRRTPSGELLQWRLTRGEPDRRDLTVPFLIDWGTTPQPGLGDLPTLELLALRVEHPDPEALAATYAVLGVATEVVRAEAFAIVATVQGPDGPVELR